jgi:hypothetical protein
LNHPGRNWSFRVALRNHKKNKKTLRNLFR